MNVRILLSAVGDIMPTYWTNETRHQYQNFKKCLIAEAIEAWNKRQPNEKAARFMVQLPSEYGAHFRFLVVTQTENGDLIVGKSQ